MERVRDDGPEHVQLLEKHLGNLVVFLTNRGGQATFGQIIDEFIPSQANMYDADFYEARVLGMTTSRLDFTPQGDGLSLELSAEDY